VQQLNKSFPRLLSSGYDTVLLHIASNMYSVFTHIYIFLALLLPFVPLSLCENGRWLRRPAYPTECMNVCAQEIIEMFGAYEVDIVCPKFLFETSPVVIAASFLLES
jgi:hypothetical protein